MDSGSRQVARPGTLAAVIVSFHGSVVAPGEWAEGLSCQVLQLRNGCALEAAFDFIDRADDQLIARLGLRRVDGVGGQLEHAGGLNPQGGDTEVGKMLNGVQDFVLLVEVNQVEREEDSKGMDALGGDDPQTFVELELKLADEPFEAREGGVRRRDAEAEEALAGLVIDAVRWFLH